MNLSALLEPYITDLSATQIAQVSTYLDLLLRWNAKTNLTSIRDPEHIVSRHFGESFFLARTLFGPDLSCRAERGIPTLTNPPAGVLKLPDRSITGLPDVLDLGSGAGFPGIPLKIACPDVTLTLVEAHHTKAVFLREVLRALDLNAEVKNVRAEQLPPASAEIVTFRAVEHFDSILPIAARLVEMTDEKRSEDEDEMEAARRRAAGQEKTMWEQAPPPGVPGTQRVTECSPVQATRSLADSRSISQPERVHCPPSTVHGLVLLISSAQISRAREILPTWRFHPEIPIPKSQNRVIQLVEPNPWDTREP